VLTDGSGEAQVYAEGSVLEDLLQVPPTQWRELCDHVRTLGNITYSRAAATLQPPNQVRRPDGAVVFFSP